jgi:hypothetical protein
MLLTATDDVVIAEPIAGWRAWRLALDRRGVWLAPIGRVGPGRGWRARPPEEGARLRSRAGFDVEERPALLLGERPRD